MKPEQILAIASSLNTWAAAGITLVGGVKSLIGIIHGSEKSDAELNAILHAVAADAKKRADEREGKPN